MSTSHKHGSRRAKLTTGARLIIGDLILAEGAVRAARPEKGGFFFFEARQVTHPYHNHPPQLESSLPMHWCILRESCSAQLSRYQSFEPGSLGDVEDFIRGLASIAFDTPGAWFQFAIRMQSSGVLIGDLGVHVMADDPRQVEIGCTVAPAHQGLGYATEAVLGILGYLFECVHKHRVFASVDPRNTASIALLRRVGMRQEAHFHESLWFKGEWADDVVFGILESEWGRR